MKVVGTSQRAGFTIIEVMLFLAITSALVVALLATVGLTITRQRFSDTINSTQAFLQSQENETLNVVNVRNDGTTCGTGGSNIRGSSGCVVLGKAMDFTPGSSKIKTYNVIGQSPTNDTGATGAALLAQYNPRVDATSGQDFDIAWSEPVYKMHPNTVTRVLLLRSPESGLVLTFGGNDNVAASVGAGVKPINICFNSQDIMNTVSMVSLSGVSGSEGITTKFGLTGTEQGSAC